MTIGEIRLEGDFECMKPNVCQECKFYSIFKWRKKTGVHHVVLDSDKRGPKHLLILSTYRQT